MSKKIKFLVMLLVGFNAVSLFCQTAPVRIGLRSVEQIRTKLVEFQDEIIANPTIKFVAIYAIGSDRKNWEHDICYSNSGGTFYLFIAENKKIGTLFVIKTYDKLPKKISESEVFSVEELDSFIYFCTKLIYRTYPY